MQIHDFETNTTQQSFDHPPTFNLNEWVYIGASVYKHTINRMEDLFDVNIVTRTLAGVEAQTTFTSQNFKIYCQSRNYNTLQIFKNAPSPFKYYLGSYYFSDKFKFTGKF